MKIYEEDKERYIKSMKALYQQNGYTMTMESEQMLTLCAESYVYQRAVVRIESRIRNVLYECVGKTFLM